MEEDITLLSYCLISTKNSIASSLIHHMLDDIDKDIKNKNERSNIFKKGILLDRRTFFIKCE